MKPIRLLAAMFVTLLFACNNDKPKEVPSSDEETETTTVPVYAIWTPKKSSDIYNGLYDPMSRYIKLCKSRQEIQIQDTSEIKIENDGKCYKQGENFAMIIIKRDSVAAPLFLTVLHVDSVTKNIVGVTDDKDTIATSIKSMDVTNFDKLKREYSNPPLRQVEIDKIKKYYSPEKKVQNRLKKERALKRQTQ